MKSIWIASLLLFSLIACKEFNNSSATEDSSPTDTTTHEEADKLQERVYALDEHGNRGELLFIIEGDKLFTVENGEKDKLLLERKGNKAYSYENDPEGKEAIFIFEGDRYWEIDPETGEKGALIFDRQGDTIYQMGESGLEASFVVE